jgi:hypothetical protein
MFDSRNRLPSDSRARRRAIVCAYAILWVYLAGFALILAGCGGGGSTAGLPAASPSPPSSPPSSPPVSSSSRVGSVTIEVTTSSGTPVPGVAVSLNGGFDGRSADTDAAGRVRFADIPGGEASVNTYARGFHDSRSRIFVTPDAGTIATVILEHVTEAIPVVLGTRAVPASDGLSLTVDVDIAVLDENGEATPTLTAAEFAGMESDCAWGWGCVYDDTGLRLPSEYFISMDPDAFSWSAAAPPSPMTTALLMEQSAAMAEFDPEGSRLGAVNAFLDSVIPPNTIALATYRGTPPAPVLTTYGPFTSDGAQFRDAVDAMAGQEGGTNPLYDAVIEMLSFTATHAPDGPNDPARNLVVLTSSWSSSYDQWLTAVATSRALGIPVVAIGGHEAAVDIAARTGGPSVVVDYPAQYPVVFANLASIVGRGLGFNRVRLVLDSGAYYGPGAQAVFRPGSTVWAYVWVRIGPNTRILVPVVIPIQ